MTAQNGIDLSKLSSVTFPKETLRKNGISKNDVSKTNDDILHLSSATIQKLLQNDVLKQRHLVSHVWRQAFAQIQVILGRTINKL